MQTSTLIEATPEHLEGLKSRRESQIGQVIFFWIIGFATLATLYFFDDGVAQEVFALLPLTVIILLFLTAYPMYQIFLLNRNLKNAKLILYKTVITRCRSDWHFWDRSGFALEFGSKVNDAYQKRMTLPTTNQNSEVAMQIRTKLEKQQPLPAEVYMWQYGDFMAQISF
ncbi:MAG: hypothetical protein JJT94_00730 [Bernardetiaceae bacterium]|nr:hypothetical protein [Bernardetiaceae bacterium]